MKIPGLNTSYFSGATSSDRGAEAPAKLERKRAHSSTGNSLVKKLIGVGVGVAVAQGLVIPVAAQLGQMPLPNNGLPHAQGAGPLPPVHTCPPGYWLQANHVVEIPVNYGPPTGVTQNWARAHFNKHKDLGWGTCTELAYSLAAENLPPGSLGYCDNIWFKSHKNGPVNLWVGVGAQLRFCCPN